MSHRSGSIRPLRTLTRALSRGFWREISPLELPQQIARSDFTHQANEILESLIKVAILFTYKGIIEVQLNRSVAKNSLSRRILQEVK